MNLEHLLEIPIIRRAYMCAKRAHSGQFRLDGTTPFIEHPKRVALKVAQLNGSNQLVAAALLHDVVEDSDTTLTQINYNFSNYITNIVDALTHRENESYVDYIKRLSENLDAITIKRCDIEDNLSGIDGKITNRYHREKHQLALAYFDLIELGG